MNKYSKIIVTVLLLAIMVSVVPVEARAQELVEGDSNVERISGNSRVETAIEVSKRAYPEKVETVFLAGYSGDADALTATFMAGKMEAPLLLADRNKLSPKLGEEIHRLDPKEIILLGGENAISKNIQDELEAKKYNTRRIQGKSRIETAIKVALDYYSGTTVEEVFLVEYNSLVDALAIGPVAAKTAIPVLITNKDKMPKEVKDFLEKQGVKKATIVGGEGTVSKRGMEEIGKYVDKVDRVSGNDRIETSLKIAEKYFREPKAAFVSNGWKNADALIGGYFAALEDGPIILSSERDLRDDVLNFISKTDVKTYVLGGEGVINNHVYEVIDWGLGDTTLPKPEPKPEVKPEPKPEPKPEEKPEDSPSDKNLLTDKRDVEKAIEKELNLMKNKVLLNISPKFTKEDIEDIVKDISNYGTYMSSSLEEVKYSSKSLKGKTQLTLDFKYYNTKEEEDFVDRQVERILGEIITPGMSDFEKILEVHDYITNNADPAKNKDRRFHSAYTFFKEGLGTSQAYTLATYKLLDALGIENYYLSSGEGDKLSVWNLVNLNGKYYNMDTIADESIKFINGVRVDSFSYRNFLISDEKYNAKRNSDNHPRATDKSYEALSGADRLYVYDERVYYQQDIMEEYIPGEMGDYDTLNCFSLKTLETERVIEEHVEYLVKHGSKLYFSAYDRPALLSMDLENHQIEVLREERVHLLSIEYPYLKFEVFLPHGTEVITIDIR